MVSTDSDSSLLLPSSSTKKPPQDKYHLAYITYFILGFGYLLPWNAFITAVDYFSYLYPQASVDRIFAGRVGFYGGFYVTVGSVGLSGVADALVQGSIVGSAGELPERYMQAVIAGTAASGSGKTIGSPLTVVSIQSSVFSHSLLLGYVK
ncbi:equilibrative nucleotide transporter 1-like protein [Trifolium pratense]|uniref:Equilibrative nucleotide transporter 1-like protein n=1 Tax=Trifolium pratense TaxID=57577 RepID=A0A2K3N8M6_TRIPR|nr:equilibrative nucleotide transporter 1-like protein [Trifolium pratense]